MTTSPFRLMQLLGVAWLLIVVASGQEGSCPSSAVLGTDGGFDVGGEEPLCYVSRVNATLATITEQANNGNGIVFNNNTFNLINQDLYRRDTGNDLILLNRCFDQTSLEVQNLFAFADGPANTNVGGESSSLVKGETFRFRVTIVSNLTTVNPDIDFLALGGNFTIHTRLNLCDAFQLGFCSPLDDTTQLDASVTPFDTDVGSLPGDDFPPGDDRWAYNPNITLKGMVLNSGSRVVTRWIRWRMRETFSESPLYNTSVDISLVLPPEVKTGAYFVLGHVVMNFDVGSFIERIDIADAVLTNAVYVVDPPIVKGVSRGIIIYLGVIIGFFGLAQLGALLYMLWHINHPAMKLAQGYFLVALAFAGLVQTVFTFTYLPLADWYCASHGLSVILPMHIGGCIVVARIWRVHMTLSVAVKLGRTSGNRKEGFNFGMFFTKLLKWIAKLPLLVCRRRKQENLPVKGGLRQSVSALEAASLVVMLSLPQAVLQIFWLVYYGGALVEEMAPTGTLGRLVCDPETSWVFLVGVALIVLVYLSAVYIAWLARNLPSAFNEKDQIFQCAGMSAILALISVFLSGLINADPSGDPDTLVSTSTLLSANSVAPVSHVIRRSSPILSRLLASRPRCCGF